MTLHGVKWCYGGLQEVTVGYKGLRRVTWGNIGLQGATETYKGLQRLERVQ